MSLKSLAAVLLSMWIFMYSLSINKLGFFPIKSIITLAYIFSGLLLLGFRGKISFSNITFLATIAFGILVAVFTGISNGFFSSTISQLVSMSVSFLVVIISFEIFKAGQLDINRVKKALYCSVIAGMIFKLILVVMLLAGVVSAEILNMIFLDYLGGAAESIYDFRGFMSIFPRFGNAGDVFYIIAFAFMISEYSGKKVIFMWALTFSVVMISYSRYLMACFAVISIYLYFSAAKKSPVKILFLSTVIFSGVLYLADFDSVYLEIIERYSGQIQSESDAIRKEMIEILFDGFEKNPYLGVGMGGYVNEYIRSDVNLWMYETEYLALLMQLGVLGFVLIVVSYSAYVFNSIFSYHRNKDLSMQLVFCLLILYVLPLQSSLFVGTQFAASLLSIFILSRKINSNKFIL